MLHHKVLIAEDNDEAREILREFIHLHNEFTTVHEIDNGEDLLQAVQDCKPDLLMLDINMPKMNGVEAIQECLDVYPDLLFVFVTAYDDYAARAFELNAVDYLVKPIQKRRVFAALEKVKERLKKESKGQGSSYKKIEVKFGREIYFINLHDILFIEKVSRKLYIHTNHNVYETVETLEHFEKNLNDSFVKCHRSCIINIHSLGCIKISGKSYYGYFPGYATPAPISKQKIEEVKERVKQTI